MPMSAPNRVTISVVKNDKWIRRSGVISISAVQEGNLSPFSFLLDQGSSVCSS